MPTSSKTPNQQFQLLVEAVPDRNWPAEVRLRKCLKSMLRSFGLRCVSVSPAVDDTDGSVNRRTGD